MYKYFEPDKGDANSQDLTKKREREEDEEETKVS